MAVPWLTTRLAFELLGDSRLGARARRVAYMCEAPFEHGSEDDPRAASGGVLDQQIDTNEVSRKPQQTLDDIIATACEANEIREEALRSTGRSRRYAAIRAEIAAAALDAGVASLAEVARRFARSESVLCHSLSRYRP